MYFNPFVYTPIQFGSSQRSTAEVASTPNSFQVVPIQFGPPPPPPPKRKLRYFESNLIPEETLTYISTIFEIIEERTPEAHPRRQNGVAYVPNINVPDIRSKLEMRIPSIMKKMPYLTNNQIRYLFTAPRRNTTNAKRYWGIISARIAHGDNSLHEDHEQVFFYLKYL